MINEIFVIITKIKFGVDGDVVDRLHHKYTVFLLIFLALFLTTDALVGEKIKCFVPVNYPGTWHKYINRLCWVKNTYYVPMDESVAEAKENGDIREVLYYQWAAIILCLSAILFYLPCKLWYFFAERSGLDIDNMIKTCSNFAVVLDEGKRKSTFTNLALFLDRFFDAQAMNLSKQSRPLYRLLHCCSRSSGSYLGFGYLVTKAVYLANAVAQFVFMTQFLGHSTQFETFGLSVTKFVSEGMVWEDQSRFPRVTLCDFNKRVLGDIDKEETVQCVLPQNIFIEKAFIIVWWWLVMLIAVTALNLVQWTVRIYGAPDNRSYIKGMLRTVEKYPLHQEDLLRNPGIRKKLDFFLKYYLMQDGVFVLRLVSKNVSALMMGQIVGEIWGHFTGNFEEEMRQRGIEDPDLCNDGAALVGREESTEGDSDEEEGYEDPDYTEGGTMEADRQRPRLYPNPKE